MKKIFWTREEETASISQILQCPSAPHHSWDETLTNPLWCSTRSRERWVLPTLCLPCGRCLLCCSSDKPISVPRQNLCIWIFHWQNFSSHRSGCGRLIHSLLISSPCHLLKKALCSESIKNTPPPTGAKHYVILAIVLFACLHSTYHHMKLNLHNLISFLRNRALFCSLLCPQFLKHDH